MKLWTFGVPHASTWKTWLFNENKTTLQIRSASYPIRFLVRPRTPLHAHGPCLLDLSLDPLFLSHLAHVALPVPLLRGSAYTQRSLSLLENFSLSSQGSKNRS